MKLLILGANGMLGQMVFKFFTGEKKYSVLIQNDRFDAAEPRLFVEKINGINPEIVINCIGSIKQKIPGKQNLYDINARLPGALSKYLNKKIYLIHPSTDCVFSGKSIKPYQGHELPDAEDDYGISKSMGDLCLANRPRTLIVRTSIIGPDSRINSMGLLAWFLRQSTSNVVPGYINHNWNGVTTLEWCQTIESIIPKIDLFKKTKTVQLGTKKTVSKFELLNIVNDIYSCGVEIIPTKHIETINRSLMPDIVAESIKQQLSHLFVYQRKS